MFLNWTVSGHGSIPLMSKQNFRRRDEREKMESRRYVRTEEFSEVLKVVLNDSLFCCWLRGSTYIDNVSTRVSLRYSDTCLKFTRRQARGVAAEEISHLLDRQCPSRLSMLISIPARLRSVWQLWKTTFS